MRFLAIICVCVLPTLLGNEGRGQVYGSERHCAIVNPMVHMKDVVIFNRPIGHKHQIAIYKLLLDLTGIRHFLRVSAGHIKQYSQTFTQFREEDIYVASGHFPLWIPERRSVVIMDNYHPKFGVNFFRWRFSFIRIVKKLPDWLLILEYRRLIGWGQPRSLIFSHLFCDCIDAALSRSHLFLSQSRCQQSTFIVRIGIADQDFALSPHLSKLGNKCSCGQCCDGYSYDSQERIPLVFGIHLAEETFHPVRGKPSINGLPYWRAISCVIGGGFTLWLGLLYSRIYAGKFRMLVGFGICGIGFWVLWHGLTLFLQYELNGETVTQKYLLTSLNYRNTFIAGEGHMANVLNTDKQVAIIGALAEGSSIRSIERQTSVHRDTIMRLGVRVGQGCQRLLDQKMRNLSCQHIELDEIGGLIGKKEKHVRPDDNPQLGDVWTFCAIDADTKLVPSFKVGKRDLPTANAFVSDLASRLPNRVQISSDALNAYVQAVENAFGANVDFAQIVKAYVFDESDDRHYSAPEIVITEKRRVAGMPDMRMASTSYIERLNGTTRLHMRRLTRLTYEFSKKLENFEAAVGLHFAYYNLVKRHNTLRCTPAMAAGIERDFWSVGNLVEAAA